MGDMMRNMDEKWMRLALVEATKGIGRTHPNPRVGAVIVRDGELLATGFHHACGSHHAEVDALLKVDSAKGATIYVTLEPCAAVGKTPACSNAILEAGISRVVFASSDPNPAMAGGGTLLQKAGLEVSSGVCQEEADALNRPFFHYVKTQLPWVIAKAAISLDGKLATHTNHSQWISGAESRKHAHALRAECDAIVVGVGTLLHDNPSLTIRDAKLIHGAPLRVVMANMAPHFFADCKLLSKEAKTRFYVTTETKEADVWRQAGVDVVNCTDRKACFAHLASEGFLQILLEGGGKLHAECFEAQISQEIALYQAPLLIGGKEAVGFWHGVGISTMAEAPKISHVQYQPLGADMLIRGDIVYPA